MVRLSIGTPADNKWKFMLEGVAVQETPVIDGEKVRCSHASPECDATYGGDGVTAGEMSFADVTVLQEVRCCRRRQ
jgi:hypothetical protein